MAFGSTRRANIRVEEDKNLQNLVEAQTEYVTIYGKAWDFQVTEILKTSLEENLEMVKDSIQYLIQNEKKVFFDAEHFFDGYLDNPKYSMQVIKTAQQAGAIGIILCDTNGGCSMTQIEEICKKVVTEIKGIELGIHCHNDMELAVANSIVAIDCGITQVPGADFHEFNRF